MRHSDRTFTRAAIAFAVLLIPATAIAQTAPPPAAAERVTTALQTAIHPPVPPYVPPTKEVDLMTLEGTALFGAQWKSMEAKIVEVPAVPRSLPEFKTTHDIQPHAEEAGFDDSSWPVITPKSLGDPRGGGRVSFIWYRAKLTIPDKLGDFSTAGTTVVLSVTVDDYAEVWINGLMPRRIGFVSPGTIQGFNLPNRLVLAEGVKPGDQFQIAIFGANGPISATPTNWVWFRQAKVEFYSRLASFQ
jgi:gluconolactonase